MLPFRSFFLTVAGEQAEKISFRLRLPEQENLIKIIRMLIIC